MKRRKRIGRKKEEEKRGRGRGGKKEKGEGREMENEEGGQRKEMVVEEEGEGRERGERESEPVCVCGGGVEGKENMNAEPSCSNIQSVSGMKHKKLLIVISPGELERDQEIFFSHFISVGICLP